MEHDKCLQLLASLQGQTVHIPDLYPLFEGWSADDVNPLRQPLTKILHEWYRRSTLPPAVA